MAPLLFLIYLNDKNRCSDLKLVHYADGITAYTSNSSLDHFIEHENFELSKNSDWLCANRPSLIVSESSYSICSNRKVNTAPDVLIRGQTLQQSNEIKFLGVIFDDKLSFGNHIDFVCRKLRRSIAVINELSTFIPRNSLGCLYFRLKYLHIIYSVDVRG